MFIVNRDTGVKLGYCTLSGRSKPSLVVYNPLTNTYRKYATFNNDIAADDFMQVLIQMIGLSQEGEQK